MTDFNLYKGLLKEQQDEMNQFKTFKEIAHNQKYTVIGKMNESDKSFPTRPIDISKKILLVMNIKNRNRH